MTTNVHLPVLGFGNTLRKDAWWAGPLATFAVLTTFIAYATFRAFENDFYAAGPYLSPFYSPLIETAGWIPSWLAWVSPAMLILPGPLSFRLTCYYYRKAYYRSFAMDPPACAVGESSPHKYNGETKLLLFQNLHRFALYVAIIFWVILSWDVVKAVWSKEGLHVGLGAVVMFVNITLIGLYTFSCHAFRHLVGGSVNRYSRAPLGALRHSLWRWVTKVNEHHALMAWLSLFGVGLTDFYIRLLATGTIHDLRFF